MESAAASRAGARLLGEIEETSLDELLASLRKLFPATASDSADDDGFGHITSPRLGAFPIEPLDDLVNRHFSATQSAPLAVTDRYLPLLYHLIVTLVMPPHNKVVLVVDMEHRFDVSALLDWEPWKQVPTWQEQGTSLQGEQQASTIEKASGSAKGPALQTLPAPGTATGVQPADLDHVYIQRPALDAHTRVGDAVAAAERFMLYGAHGSRSREWWGTIVIGGELYPDRAASAATLSLSDLLPAPLSPITRVTAGWEGWLRVDREEVPGFDASMSVEEMLAKREEHQAAVDATGWVASCAWGSFVFGRPDE